jgi:hypothetical protein
MANALVVLGATFSLVFTPAWTGSITAALFAVLIVCPFALLAQARHASRRGQWPKAARLLGWAVLLHPTAWTRFELMLSRAQSADPEQGYQVALARIEATGSPKQMAFARLLLAQERRDWRALVSLARAGNVEFSEAKPREIRALGELGQLADMVHTYQSAERWLLLAKRHECLLFVCAFTGRLGCVQHLLDRPLVAENEDVKAYWMAVARLRADREDLAARATLQGLAEGSLEARMRRSAAEQLQRADQAAPPFPPVAQETERLIDTMLLDSRQNRPPRLKWSTKAHVRGFLLLVLIILLAVLQRYYR